MEGCGACGYHDTSGRLYEEQSQRLKGIYALDLLLHLMLGSIGEYSDSLITVHLTIGRWQLTTRKKVRGGTDER